MAIATSNAYINPQFTKTTKKQQQKRKRSAKIEIVHIDDIHDDPGVDFINWIKITKNKLAERESKLMSLRVNILHELISKQVEQFKVINARMKIYIDTQLYENMFRKDLIHNCLEKLNTQLLVPWNGVVLNHTKNKFDTYRKYFTTARSWFDQRKRSILGQYLWISIFDTINEFTKIAAKRYFNERFIELQLQFAESLKLQIITNIFKQKVKLPSTRAHSLVSCSILKECHKFQLYVRTNIAENIMVNRYLQKNPSMSALTLMGLVIDELQVAANKSMSMFQRDVYQLYDEFNFTPVYIEPLTDYSGNIHNLNRQQISNSDSKDNYNAFGDDISEISSVTNEINHNMNNNNIWVDNDSISQISSITNDLFVAEMNATMNNKDCCYGACHSPTYSVTNQRFSPFI